MRKLIRVITALLACAALLSGSAAFASETEDDDLKKLAEMLGITDIEEIEFHPPDWTLLARDREWHTPAEGSPVKCDHEVCYWTTPMGYTDEEAVWKILTAPVTVLDYNQRQQYKVRKEPDPNCTEYTGEVTGTSQGVHVLERGDEWTLIEAYSSSFEGSKVKNYAGKFQGYVETKLLKEVEVDQTCGIVIDKQFQRLYIYKDGKLFSTLLCSTGYYNPKKGTKWNETPAGEFLCVSWTGELRLKADDTGDVYMRCAMAIRINDGILLHEVPKMLEKDGVTWSYSTCEGYLGEKASHGCIRIQRLKNPEGINHEWLWKNLSNGSKKGQAYTKVIIWDDAGRELDYPSDDLKLYYNPKHYSAYYHSTPTCWRIKGSSKNTEFTYGELENKTYRDKRPCPCCAPMPRKSAIDTINKKNAR